MKPLREACPTPESIRGCENCPFRTKKIGGRGPFDSPFVIVGESPGSQELAKEVPFIGPSGQMLYDVLKEVGFESLGVEPYVTNALSCYPVDKDIPKMQSATACCNGRLHQELLAHPREVILCLGASAAWSVTGNYGLKITRDRGKVLKTNLATKGVVLAVHPAYLMRNGGGLPFWKKDIRSAVELFNGTLMSVWLEPTWEVIETRERLAEVVEEYITKEMITGDFETEGFQSLFQRVLLLGITHNGRHVHIIPEEIWYANVDLIRRLMETPGPRWNWHNGKFDIQWAWATDEDSPGPDDRRTHKVGVNARVDEDTMLASYALNENSGFHDLDQVAQAWIGAPAHKGVMDKYYKMAPHYSLRNAPKQELHQYAAYDIAKTHLQWFPLMEELKKDQRLLDLYYKTLIPASHFFARIERYGVKVDKEKVKANVAHTNTEIAEINGRLQKYAITHMGREINFGSYIQVRELLYKHMGLGPPRCDWRTQGSDEQALVDCQRRTNHPIIHDMLLHREVVKRRGTYEINLVDHKKLVTVGNKKKEKSFKGITCPDGRVHPSFLIHGTTTGRPACKAPNLLNQPRLDRIRDQYVARPGCVFVEVDLNQAELRSLCVLSKDELLTRIYRSNEVSIHDITAKAFFGTKQQMADDPILMNKCADLMQYFGERTPEKVYKEAKMAAKTVNFGIVYGREAHSIAQMYNISHQEAQRWIDAWLATYPQAAEYIQRCRGTVSRGQKMVTPWGRMKRVGVATPEKLHDLQNQAANFPHQSIAHDILLEAAMECEPRLLEEWDAHCWNEVYDAVYFEIEADEQKIKASIDYVCEVITQVPIRRGLTHIPFIGDAKVGQRWGSMKDWKGSFGASGLKLAA
jgi:uracil-DNA glycosylase family 4